MQCVTVQWVTVQWVSVQYGGDQAGNEQAIIRVGQMKRIDAEQNEGREREKEHR